MARPKLDQPRFRLVERGGYFYIRWWEAGAWHRASTGTTDRREAERNLAQFTAAALEPVAPRTPIIGEILDAYLADRKGRVAAHNTLGYACKALKRHLGNLTVDALSVQRSRLYAQQRRDEGHMVGPSNARRLKATSDGTITRELVTLRAALRWAVEHKWINSDPRVEVPSSTPPRERWLRRDEAARLILNCDSFHVRLFVALGLYTAARAGAILSLTWPQVDFESGIINFSPGTGNKRRNPVPIASKLKPYLLKARSGATCDYVIEFGGKQVKSIKTGFNASCRRAGLTDVTPHTLRHTAATWLAIAGRPMPEIARFLGDSEKTTENVYAKHSPDYLREAAAALSDE